MRGAGEDLFSAAPLAGAAMPSGIPFEVCTMFERLALDLRSRGFTHYSADAILHRIRWHMHVERGLRDFKCNNNWTASLARWWLSRHPECPGFFETRSSRGEAAA